MTLGQFLVCAGFYGIVYAVAFARGVRAGKKL